MDGSAIDRREAESKYCALKRSRCVACGSFGKFRFIHISCFMTCSVYNSASLRVAPR
jgi:hypothetical protein